MRTTVDGKPVPEFEYSAELAISSLLDYHRKIKWKTSVEVKNITQFDHQHGLFIGG
jgi:hypothetical protein